MFQLKTVVCLLVAVFVLTSFVNSTEYVICKTLSACEAQCKKDTGSSDVYCDVYPSYYVCLCLKSASESRVKIQLAQNSTEELLEMIA